MKFLKNFKRTLAAALVGVMALSGSAFAASSPTSDTANKTTPVTAANVTADGTKDVYNTKVSGRTTLEKCNSTSETVVVSKATVKGVTYTVNVLKRNCLKNNTSVKTVKLKYANQKVLVNELTFNKSNVKTLVLTKFTKANQLTIQKDAFKGSKVKTVKVSKTMSAKEFKKLKKALKAAGFTGKVKRV